MRRCPFIMSTLCISYRKLKLMEKLNTTSKASLSQLGELVINERGSNYSALSVKSSVFWNDGLLRQLVEYGAGSTVCGHTQRLKVKMNLCFVLI